MTPRPSPRACVSQLTPYVPGRPIEHVASQWGLRDVVKLASNENPLGPSPKAMEAARRATGEVHRYPDGSASALKEALSTRHGVPLDRILVGAGSSDLIDLAMRTYVEPGEEVVVPEGIFRMIPVAAGRAGGTLVSVPTKRDHVPDLVALLHRIGRETKVVAIANPNNPTGAYARRADLASFVAAVPAHVLVILDEAYFEFSDGIVADYPNGLELLATGRSILVLRTFSKIAGLGGLRVGYGFAPEEIVSAMDRVREPFNVNAVAQAAAVAALSDTEHLTETRDLVLRERDHLLRELSARGFPPYPSIGNFLLVELPVRFAPLAIELERRGVVVRPMGGWGFPRAFRVSVGTRAENERFLSAFDELVAAGLIPTSVEAPEGARA